MYQPYQPPQTPVRPFRRRKHWYSMPILRSIASAWLALFAVTNIMLMIRLVECHHVSAAGIPPSGFSLWRVVLPVTAACLATALAILSAIPIFTSGRMTPVLWLLPLCLVMAWVLCRYDWQGVYQYGRPGSYWSWPFGIDTHATMKLLFMVAYFTAPVWMPATGFIGQKYQEQADAAKFEAELNSWRAETRNATRRLSLSSDD